MTSSELNKPIFIIGAARSGTTLLGEILSRHKDVAYWLEPKYIWRYGNPGASDDVREATEATARVKGYIQKRFTDFLIRAGKKRFMEKTPSNCYRIEFINAIFPDARFIHIIRNGDDVWRSAKIKWTSKPAGSALWRRLTSNEIPLRDLPFYMWSFVRDVPGRSFFPGRGYIWGPAFPGMADYRKAHSVEACCAMQWVTSVEHVMEGFKTVDPKRIHTIRYEDLIRDTESTISRVLNFVQLDAGDLLNFANSHVRVPSDKKIKKDIPSEVEQIISSLQKTLGYD